jgi:hypothetical protein
VAATAATGGAPAAAAELLGTQTASLGLQMGLGPSLGTPCGSWSLCRSLPWPAAAGGKMVTVGMKGHLEQQE